MSRALHPGLLACLSITLSGCAGMLGVSATPLRVGVVAQADATAEAQADARVEASVEAHAEANVEVSAHAEASAGATAGGVWASDADVVVGWTGPANPAPLPDPFAVAAAMLGGSGDVQVASVGVTGVGAGPGIDARVERDSTAGAAQGDARADGQSDARVDARTEQSEAAHGQVDGAARGHADGNVELDAHLELNVDARIELEGRRQAEARVEVDATARTRHLGGGAGVRGTHGHPARLGALIEGGLNIDGELTDLGELAPLAGESGVSAAAGVGLGARIDVGAELSASATLEHARLPEAGGETHLVVRVRGADASTGAARPSTRARVRLRLVVDRSSSMQASWSQVMGAARDLIAQLSPNDELQIVAYGTRAVEALPTSRVGNGFRARRALAQIRVGGGTNIEAGLRLAYDAGARGTDDGLTLVVLVSDGVPNGGAFTADGLAPLAARAKLEQGCRTTVVGFGNDFDAEALRAIARAGGGAYRVAPDATELATVLEAEVGAMTRVRARDVRVRVALPAGVRLTEAAGDARITAAGEVELSVPALAAGEERSLVLGVRVGAGHTATAVARVSVSYRVGAAQRRGDKTVRVARGGARLDVNAARALADADLSFALDIAARAVNNGQGDEAAGALRAHAGRMSASVDVRVRARAGAARRVARAIERLMPRASWPERRRTSLAIGALSARFGG